MTTTTTTPPAPAYRAAIAEVLTGCNRLSAALDAALALPADGYTMPDTYEHFDAWPAVRADMQGMLLALDDFKGLVEGEADHETRALVDAEA
jgi:hypothetical protein